MATIRDERETQVRFDQHNARGVELAERGFLDEAVKEFNAAISLAPNSSVAYDNLGTVYVDKGDMIKALKSYTKALEMEPSNPYALHNLGCFLSNHASKLAARCFTSALELESDLYESRFNLGLCLAADDEHEKAIQHFQDALESEQDDPDIYTNLGLSLMELKKYRDAIRSFKRAVALEPKNDAAHFSLGECYHYQGFVEEAEKCYLQAIRINASNLEAILNLASLLKSLNRKKEVRPLMRRALRLDKVFTKDFVAADEHLTEDDCQS